MPDHWTPLEADVAETFDLDGVEVTLTPNDGSTPQIVKAFWDSDSLENRELGGPRVYVADDDLPSPFPQGSTVTYPVVNGTTYTVFHKAQDGHGLTMMVLTDESTI